MDLRIDPVTGDLALDINGDVETVDGPEGVAQQIRIRLQFVKGEWFLNELEGTPWFEDVFVKAPDLRRVRAIFLRVIAGTPGVVSVPSLEVVDLGGRRYSLTYEALADTGDVVGEADFVVGGV